MKGECFGLLGENGAGKSSVIGILAGLLSPDSGEAFLDSFCIRTEMDKIYKILGVCSQFDILWPDLSGDEHLAFFARLKGYHGKLLDAEITSQLASTGLLDARSKSSKAYSGGMKRRLSVAISLTGNNRVVLLDEPTTVASSCHASLTHSLISTCAL